MMKKRPNSIKGMLDNRVDRRRILWALSLFVIMGTLAFLMLPASTLERIPTCGLEEHVHDRSCYLNCGLEEAPIVTDGAPDLACPFTPHVHTWGCYDGERLVCGYSEVYFHTHTDLCYAETEQGRALICPLQDVPMHVHGEECYTDEIVCGQEENHVHTDACFEDRIVCGMEDMPEHVHTTGCVQRVQVCTLEENHVHTDACHAKSLSCGYAEELDHVHTAVCFDAEGHAICGKVQYLSHEHNEACFANVLSGHVHTDACYSNVPQCGHVEHVHTDACYQEAPGAEDRALYFGEDESATEDELPALSQDAQEATEDEATAGEASAVEPAAEEATPAEASAGEATMGEATPGEAEAQHRVLDYQDSQFAVRVILNAEEDLPEDAVLSVHAVTEGEQYDAYAESIRAGIEDVLGIQLLDISILSGGEKVEPSAPVQVQIDCFEPLEGKKQVVHFAEKEEETAEAVQDPVIPEQKTLKLVSRSAFEAPAEVLPAFEQLESSVNGDTLIFNTSSFSVYGIVYTVDFEYVDPQTGETVKWSWPGRGAYSVASILESIGATGAIGDVSLELTEGERTEGGLWLEERADGWYLTSDEAFDETYELRVTVDGAVYVFIVKDLQYNSDANKLLQDVTIDGAEWDPDTESYIVKPGKTYGIHLTLQEGEGNGQYQMANNGTLTLTLPDGLEFTSGNTFNIYVNEAGENYTITGNTLTVEGNTLKIQLNTSDPNYQKLKDLTTAKFIIDLTGKFTTKHNEYVIDGQTDITVKIDENADVNVTKSSAVIDWNSDPDKARVKYTLQVRANGEASNVEITDTINGTGLSFDTGSIKVWHNGQQVSGWTTNNQSASGFKLTTGTLEDGQTYLVEYTATIDKSKLQGSNGSYGLDADNTVDWTDKTVTNHDLEHLVTPPSIQKGGSTQMETTSDGRTIATTTWTIQTDSNYGEENQLKHITDRLATDGLAYSGEGIHVVVTDPYQNYATVYNNTIGWSDIRAADGKSWTCDFSQIPAGGNEGKKYHYVITYTTTYDVTDAVQGQNLKNEWTDDHEHHGEGTAWVGPNPENTYDVHKEYTSKEIVEGVTVVTWTVRVTVPAAGVPANKAVLTETLPYTGSYQDTFVSYDGPTGLLDGEAVTVDATSQPGKVLFTFTKDGTPGLNRTADGKRRQIVLTLKTKCDPRWLEDDEAEQTHKNHVEFADHQSDAYYTPDKPSVKKVGRADGTTSDKLPKYSYGVTVGVISEDLFNGNTTYEGVTVYEDENGKYVEIVDTYDERLAYIEGSATVGGGDQYSQENGRSASGVTATVDAEHHKVTFRLYQNALPKNGGNLYQYYRVNYSLQVKDQATLNAMREEAIASGKAIDLDNTVLGFGESDVEVKYEPRILDKSHVTDGDKLVFTIHVNSDGLKLSDNGVLVLTDSMTNLSVQYQDINVEVAGNKTVETMDADGNPVTAPYFNMKGNEITFYLPDEAPITITYRATARGEVGPNGMIQFSNVAKLKGFEATDGGDKEYTSEAAGYGTNYAVYLYKADGLVNSNALAGAVFKLYEADEVDANGNIISGTPVRNVNGEEYTVTTSDGRGDVQKGVVRVMGSDELGWNLKPEKRYYLLEIKAPEGYALDNTKYSFVISKDGFVNYSRTPIPAPDGSGKLVQAWTYYNGDILTVKNWRKDGVLVLEKSFAGDDFDPSKMDDDQKAAIRFEIYTVNDEDGTESLWRTITYDQFIAETTDGETHYTYTIGDLPEGKYRVVEKVDDVTCRDTTYAIVDTDEGAGVNNEAANKDDRYATIVVSDEDVRNHVENKVNVTNTYDVPSEFKIYKHAEGDTSYKLPGAKFGVFNTDEETHLLPVDAEGEPTELPLSIYTTNARGRFTILRVDDPDEEHFDLDYDTVYALREIEAPEGFLVNKEPVYFYFVRPDEPTPTADSLGLPVGTVFIFEKEMDETSIPDTPDTTYLEAVKIYLDEMLDEDDSITDPVQIRVKQIASYDKEGKVTEPELSGYYNVGAIKPVTAERAHVYTIIKDESGWHLQDDEANGVVGGKLNNLPIMMFDNNIPIYFHYEVEEINPGDYIPLYGYETAEDGGTIATITNKPHTTTTTTRLRAQKKWVDINGDDVTNKMGFDDGVSLQVYRAPGVVNAGKIITNDGKTYDARNQYPIYIQVVSGKERGSIIVPFVAALPGDEIELRINKLDKNLAWNNQIRYYKTETWGTSETECSPTYQDDDVSVYSLTVPTNAPINRYRIDDYGKYLYTASIVNLTAEREGRTQLLTHEESASVGGSAVAHTVLELNKLNGWQDVSQELITSDGAGNCYSYYLLEKHGDIYSAQYSFSGDAVTIQNVETKLEIKKIWHGANGTDDVTEDVTDGEVKFTLKRYTYPMAYGSYTGAGSLKVCFEHENADLLYDLTGKKGLWYGRPDWKYLRITENHLTSDSQCTYIKKGSTVRIVLSTSGKDNTDPEKDVIKVNGVPVESDWILNPSSSAMRYSRTITLENVQSDIELSGLLDADPSGQAQVYVTVLKEPIDQNQLGTTEVIGEITLTADNVRFTPAAGYEELGISAQYGTDAWTAILNDLANSEYVEKYGQTVVYSYEAVEQVSASESFIRQENSGITHAGGSITQSNKLKPGELKVKKVVAGAAPNRTYEIAVYDSEGNYYGEDGTNYGKTPHYETFSANRERTWSPLTPGTYTVSEKDASQDGYTWTVSGTGQVKVVRGAVAEATVTNNYFKNIDYLPKITKALKAGDTEVEPWPEGVSFEFYLNFVSGVAKDGTALVRTDIVMANRHATADEQHRTGAFGNITFKKPGTYTFTIEEIEPEGAVDHKMNGIVYSTDKVTLTVVVAESETETGKLVIESATYAPANGQTGDALGGLITNTMGALNIKKTVEALNGATVDANQAFTFTVTFTDYASKAVRVQIGEAEAETKTTDAEGKLVIELKHNETATFSGLPIGTAYTVAETPVNGYTLYTVNGEVGTQASGAIAVAPASAEFVNRTTQYQFKKVWTGLPEDAVSWKISYKLQSTTVAPADQNAETEWIDVRTGTVAKEKEGNQLAAEAIETISPLPCVDANGKTLYYRAVETGYKYTLTDETETTQEVLIPAETIEVTDTIRNELTAITVEKLWKNAEGTRDEEVDHKATVTVDLYRGTEKLQEGIVISYDETAGTWVWTSGKLPKQVLNADKTAMVDAAYHVVETATSDDSFPITNARYLAEGDEGDPTAQATEHTTNGGKITVTNLKLSAYSLPSTGGAGTTLIHVIGTGLLILAAILFILDQKKRMKMD